MIDHETLMEGGSGSRLRQGEGGKTGSVVISVGAVICSETRISAISGFNGADVYLGRR